MAEILVWLEDKNPNAKAGVRGIGGYHKGDVIVVCPDGWPWSEIERTHPQWAIVKAPLLDAEVEALQAQGDGDTELKEVAKRKYRLDVDALGLVGGQSVTLTRRAVTDRAALK